MRGLAAHCTREMSDVALFTGAYTNPLASSPDTTMQAAMDAGKAA